MQRTPLWRWRLDHLLTILRVVLGVIFILGGIKIAFPADPEVFAAGYVDPATGWIAPVFAERITETLGISVSLFLKIQGVIEIVVGGLMVIGLFAPFTPIVMGLMFWAFIIANPVVGPVRLNRDMALMGFSFATALAGGGILSLDAKYRGLQSKFSERRDIILIMIRLGLAYALVTSSLFFGGPLNTSLNTTIPLFLVFVMGLLLAVGVIPRWVAAAVFIWLLLPFGQSIAAKGVFWGLEGVKRELGLMAASFVYLMAGPDRWVWPRRR